MPDGRCHWNVSPKCYTRPKSNRAFRDKKREDNMARASRVPEAAEVTSIPAEAIAAKLLGEQAFRQNQLPRLVAGIMSALSAKFPGEGQV